VALALAALLVVGYLGIVIYLVSQETALVFEAFRPMGDLRPAAPFETVELPRADGTRELVWLMRNTADSPSRPWVIFLHGNAEPVSARLNILHCERLRQLGFNIVAPEYRGFGGTPGVPSEAGVEADGRSAYDYLRTRLGVAADRIVVFGWSLGSAVAVDMASHVPVRALILEGAPSSLVDIGQMRYPYVPIRLLMRNPFESIRKIANVRAPVLFLHSPEDTIVPIEEGRRLFVAANNPKAFVEVHGGHIYAVERDPSFFPTIDTFLKKWVSR
jgi:fermentation-respiration switch protein FrsA (DUF1100 family)